LLIPAGTDSEHNSVVIIHANNFRTAKGTPMIVVKQMLAIQAAKLTQR
jgi:hypothetical protein